MSNPGVYIWDPLVRIGHWLLASVFTLNYFVLEPGDKPHQWLGYFAAAIVLLRLVHGSACQHIWFSQAKNQTVSKATNFCLKCLAQRCITLVLLTQTGQASKSFVRD